MRGPDDKTTTLLWRNRKLTPFFVSVNPSPQCILTLRLVLYFHGSVEKVVVSRLAFIVTSKDSFVLVFLTVVEKEQSSNFLMPCKLLATDNFFFFVDLLRFKYLFTRLNFEAGICSHVLNYDFPRNIEEYVHRVGRTGRAGWVVSEVSQVM